MSKALGGSHGEPFYDLFRLAVGVLAGHGVVVRAIPQRGPLRVELLPEQELRRIGPQLRDLARVDHLDDAIGADPAGAAVVEDASDELAARLERPVEKLFRGELLLDGRDEILGILHGPSSLSRSFHCQIVDFVSYHKLSKLSIANSFVFSRFCAII